MSYEHSLKHSKNLCKNCINKKLGEKDGSSSLIETVKVELEKVRF